MQRQINQRIANTDIFVFGYNPLTQTFTYSRPFTAEEAKDLTEKTNTAIGSQYKGVNGLRPGLTAKNGELVNMSTLKGIVANRALMQATNSQQGLPTIQEGIALQRAGMLPSGILIDYGLALYDEQSPDEEIAKVLGAIATAKNYVLPILASFKSLDLVKGGNRYGVTPQLVSVDGLTFGEDATKLLRENSFYQGEGTGVRRVCRSYDGNWNANWNDNLDNFNENCRMAQPRARKNENL